MIYIIAEYNRYGIKEPRIVDTTEAQKVYEQLAGEGATLPDIPGCYCNEGFDDLLWIIKE